MTTKYYKEDPDEYLQPEDITDYGCAGTMHKSEADGIYLYEGRRNGLYLRVWVNGDQEMGVDGAAGTTDFVWASRDRDSADWYIQSYYADETDGPYTMGEAMDILKEELRK